MAGSGTTTVNFGATPVGEANFTITEAGVSSASYVEAFVMHNDTTGDNGIEMHKNLGVFGKIVCSAGTGQFVAHVGMWFGRVTGQFNIRYVFTP